MHHRQKIQLLINSSSGKTTMYFVLKNNLSLSTIVHCFFLFVVWLFHRVRLCNKCLSVHKTSCNFRKPVVSMKQFSTEKNCRDHFFTRVVCIFRARQKWCSTSNWKFVFWSVEIGRLFIDFSYHQIFRYSNIFMH